MIKFLNKFKIPTILGLSIITAGLVGGVYLVLQEQIFSSQAFPNITTPNIIVSNITTDSVTISYLTNPQVPSFVTYGQQNPKGQTALDDKDQGKPTSRSLHYITLKNLIPQTQYQFKAHFGKTTSDTIIFTTSGQSINQAKLAPIIGSILTDDNKPLNEGVAYLSISDTVTLSSPVKEGNFLIPIAQIETPEETIAKLTIISEAGQSSALVKLTPFLLPLPPLKLGQNIDLTQLTPQPTPSADDLKKYDLFVDGKINSADNAVILDNLGKNFKNKKADLDGNGIVDRKDLSLMSQKLKELGIQ